MTTVAVLINGKEFQLDPETAKNMQLFKQADAIEKLSLSKPYEINLIDEPTWLEILRICKITNNNFPEVSKVKTSNLHEVIVNSNELADTLTKLSPDEMNKLYRAAQFLNMKSLRKCLAAALACRVYIKPTIDDYKNKRKELNITHEITAETSRKFKENYPFMN